MEIFLLESTPRTSLGRRRRILPCGDGGDAHGPDERRQAAGAVHRRRRICPICWIEWNFSAEWASILFLSRWVQCRWGHRGRPKLSFPAAAGRARRPLALASAPGRIDRKKKPRSQELCLLRLASSLISFSSLPSDGAGMGSYVQVEEQAVPVYESGAEVLQKLQEEWRSGGKQSAPTYPAMYSSVVGGIILDPAMMVVPMDDHMVHRGHGVFDTAMLLDGFLYELDAHLDRFLRSAASARISSPFPRDALRAILVQMAAASGCRRGSIRYWLSAGPGDFLLSPRGCPSPALYAVVIAADYEQCRDEGVRAVTTSVPMKPPLFATTKNVNYLPNVLSIMDAEDRGAFASVWVDDQGFVAEGPMVNVAFVTPDRHLVLPAFDRILSGCTAKRLLALAPRLVEAGMLAGVATRNIAVDEARRSVEMAFVGSGLPVLPVVQWDGQPIGDGKVGPMMAALSDLLWEDMKSGPDRIAVPYTD